jgi:hypothetical protein
MIVEFERIGSLDRSSEKEVRKVKSRVLFVTKGDDRDFSEGFTYATELARISEGGVFVLFLYDKDVIKKFEDEMAAAAVAAEGDVESARSILSEREHELQKEADQKVRLLQSLCQGSHPIVEHRISTNEVVSAIKTVLQSHPTIEIVILSPSLMDSDRSISFKRIKRKISRPVVTMSKPARV